MAGMYGPPGVSKSPGPYDGEIGSKCQAALRVSPAGGGESTVTPFLVQSYSVSLSERIQEVNTLSETAHIYTFGRTLPKLTVTGYFMHPGFFKGDDAGTFFSTYEKIRAKESGKEKKTLVDVLLSGVKKLFKCVLVSVNFNHAVEMEALVSATLSFVVLESFELNIPSGGGSGGGDLTTTRGDGTAFERSPERRAEAALTDVDIS